MKKKVALSLASGGARGIAHIGVIEDFERQGYEITSVSGTSMGALVGGIYCTRGLEVYKDWMCDLDKRKVFSLVDFTISSEGLVKGNKVLDEIQKMVPDVQIENMRIPFSAVATDIISGKEVVFKQGSLFQAIRASISIPSLFVPYRMGKKLLVDGGIINPLPLSCIERRDDDILVAVDLSAIHVKKNKTKIEKSSTEKGILTRIKQILIDRDYNMKEQENNDSLNYTSLLLQSSDIMSRKISELSIEMYKPDILIDIPRTYHTLEFYKSEEIVEQGRKAAKKAISKYEKQQHELSIEQ